MVAGEEPLEIRLEGEPVAVTMRTPTPGHDAELAIGFLLGEAIVTPEQIARVERMPRRRGRGRDRRRAPVAAARAAPGWQQDRQRSLYATSSCGVCGKASIDAVRLRRSRWRTGPCSTPRS